MESCYKCGKETSFIVAGGRFTHFLGNTIHGFCEPHLEEATLASYRATVAFGISNPYMTVSREFSMKEIRRMEIEKEGPMLASGEIDNKLTHKANFFADRYRRQPERNP